MPEVKRFIIRLYHPNGSYVATQELESYNPDPQIPIDSICRSMTANEMSRTGYNSESEMKQLGYEFRVFEEVTDKYIKVN